ncbi:hypothetical protein PR048_006363 [Dryococelus australis]|uniref:Uncharacterized protein n=1 Tax=Dryococelus australis TaxID=614101 RepID=A0ABQ9IAR6_9NEOP|nr:hypothetical protein PR048_006363 [Dryococelus australis]
MMGRGETGDPEKTRRPTASSGTIPTCENPVTRPVIEPGSPWLVEPRTIDLHYPSVFLEPPSANIILRLFMRAPSFSILAVLSCLRYDHGNSRCLLPPRSLLLKRFKFLLAFFPPPPPPQIVPSLEASTCWELFCANEEYSPSPRISRYLVLDNHLWASDTAVHLVIGCSREVSMEQYWNEGAWKTGDRRQNPPTSGSGIVRHDSHFGKFVVNRPGIEPGSPWWEASSLTAWPPEEAANHLYFGLVAESGAQVRTASKNTLCTRRRLRPLRKIRNRQTSNFLVSTPSKDWANIRWRANKRSRASGKSCLAERGNKTQGRALTFSARYILASGFCSGRVLHAGVDWDKGGGARRGRHPRSETNLRHKSFSCTLGDDTSLLPFRGTNGAKASRAPLHRSPENSFPFSVHATREVSVPAEKWLTPKAVLQAPSRTAGFTQFHTLSSIQATNTSLAVVPQSSVIVHISLSSSTLDEVASVKRLPAAGPRQYTFRLRPPPRIVSNSRDASRRAEMPASFTRTFLRRRQTHRNLQQGRGAVTQAWRRASRQPDGRCPLFTSFPETGGGGGRVQEATSLSARERGEVRDWHDRRRDHLPAQTAVQITYIEDGNLAMEEGRWKVQSYSAPNHGRNSRNPFKNPCVFPYEVEGKRGGGVLLQRTVCRRGVEEIACDGRAGGKCRATRAPMSCGVPSRTLGEIRPPGLPDAHGPSSQHIPVHPLNSSASTAGRRRDCDIIQVAAVNYALSCWASDGAASGSAWGRGMVEMSHTPPNWTTHRAPV